MGLVQVSRARIPCNFIVEERRGREGREREEERSAETAS